MAEAQDSFGHRRAPNVHVPVEDDVLYEDDAATATSSIETPDLKQPVEAMSISTSIGKLFFPLHHFSLSTDRPYAKLRRSSGRIRRSQKFKGEGVPPLGVFHNCWKFCGKLSLVGSFTRPSVSPPSPRNRLYLHSLWRGYEFLARSPATGRIQSKSP